MKKQLIEVKKTILDIESEKIENTSFVKWFGKKTECIGDNQMISKDCGICAESVFAELSGVEFPKNGMLVMDNESRYGYFMVITQEDMSALMNCEKHITDVVKPITSENINSKYVGFYIFVSATHSLMNLDSQYISIPIFMDYVMTRLTNEEYDLEDALVKIKNCPYVCNADKVEITDIPYYNATETEDRKIDFNILLPYEKYVTYKGFNNTWEAQNYILKDILGLIKYV